MTTWPPRTAAALCDLDGVLVDSRGPILRAWHGFADRHGLSHQLVEATIHGRPVDESVRLLAPECDVEAETERLGERELTDLQGVSALPGARELRERLGDDRFAVVTSCFRPLALARLGAAGLRPPRVLVTRESVRAGKPDPAGYLKAARDLRLAPGGCVVVEDSPVGLAAGRAAGAITVGVTTTHVAQDLTADLVVRDIADILPRFEP